MKLNELKLEFRKVAIKKSAIVGALTIILWGTYYYNSSTFDNLTNVQNTYNSLESELNAKMFTYDEAEKNLKTYLSIPANKTPSDQNYNFGFMRLRALVPQIDKLKSLYFFKALDYTIGDIKKNDQLSSQDLESYENPIAFNFQGATDETVFSFINDLKIYLPGYITVTSFEIIKKAPVDQVAATNYVSRPEYSFVMGKIDVNWLIVQKIKKAENPQNLPPQ